MIPGGAAIDFELPSFVNGGPEEKFKLSSYKGKYVLLLFYPVDFGYVTPTEFYELETLMPAFRDGHCEVVGISTEILQSQRDWWSADKADAGLGKIPDVRFISDRFGDVCSKYNVLKVNEHVSFRASFLINPKGDIVGIEKSDLPVGVHAKEQLRQLQADQQNAPTPANWTRDMPKQSQAAHSPADQAGQAGQAGQNGQHGQAGQAGQAGQSSALQAGEPPAGQTPARQAGQAGKPLVGQTPASQAVQPAKTPN